MPFGLMVKTKRPDGTWEEVNIIPKPGDNMFDLYVQAGLFPSHLPVPKPWATTAHDPGTDAGTGSTASSSAASTNASNTKASKPHANTVASTDASTNEPPGPVAGKGAYINSLD